MSDEPEPTDPIEAVGETIISALPEKFQTEEVAYGLGRVCGFLTGFAVGRAVMRLLFPRNERDEK
jgi:hypothetical protein